MTKDKKNYSSTYERLIHEDVDFEKDLKVKYQEFILSELLLAIMQENHISIRKLAQEAGVSPSLVQDLRSGRKDNLTFKNFSNIFDALGYDIILEKRCKGRKIELSKRMKVSNRSIKRKSLSTI